MEMNQKEILRYLGYGKNQADEAVMALILECWKELEEAAEFRVVSQQYPLKLTGETGIDMTCFQTESKDLMKNLSGCEEVLLFAATIGSQVDMLIHRYNRLQVSKAVVLQAAAAAMLEDFCDRFNEEFRKEQETKGYYLRPRFSPGYGDFSLTCQQELLRSLEAGKRVGIALTDSLLMAPSKSVTAVIGISRRKSSCQVKGCEACQKTDCEYRRG